MVTRRRTYTQEQRSALLRSLHAHHQVVELEKANLREMGVTTTRTFTRVCPDMHVHVEMQYVATFPAAKMDIHFALFSIN